MCVAAGAITATEALIGSIGVTVASTAASLYAQSRQASAQAKAIRAQSQEQANEIARSAGERDSQAAQEARMARAQAAVAASGAGINLGSNSFLASLQTTSMNQFNEKGLILENETAQQGARIAETNSELATKASGPTALGALADVGIAGAGAYAQGELAYDKGVKSRYLPLINP